MARVKLTIKGPSDAELARMLSGVPTLEKFRVGDQVVRAGAKPITTRFRQLIPRSKESDTRKRSKSQRQGKDPDGPPVDWKTPLWTTVKSVVRKGNSSNRGGAIAIVGPEIVAAGAKIYLIAEHKSSTRRVIYWGRDAGKTVNKLRNLAVQAFDETRSQQASAMKVKLKQVMDKIYIG